MLDRRAFAAEGNSGAAKFCAHTTTIKPNTFASLPPTTPHTGCTVSGSPRDDPWPRLVIFHPDARGQCDCSRAKARLKLAWPWNACGGSLPHSLPRTENPPAYSTQPTDRGGWRYGLSPASAGTAAVLFLFPSGARHRDAIAPTLHSTARGDQFGRAVHRARLDLRDRR